MSNFKEGETVILYINFDNISQLSLKSGSILDNRYGTFHHDDIINKVKNGDYIPSRTPMVPRRQGRKRKEETDQLEEKVESFSKAIILKMDNELFTNSVPHQTQIIYSNSISTIICGLQINSFDSVVFESGTGTGSLSFGLLKRAKHLFTFEYNQERFLLAKGVLERATGWPEIGVGGSVLCDNTSIENNSEILKKVTLNDSSNDTNDDIVNKNHTTNDDGSDIVNNNDNTNNNITNKSLDNLYPSLTLINRDIVTNSFPKLSKNHNEIQITSEMHQLGFQNNEYILSEFPKHTTTTTPLVDAIFLDLPSPHLVVVSPGVIFNLKFGGRICTFCPCIEQCQSVTKALSNFRFKIDDDFSMAFVNIETVETWVNGYGLITKTEGESIESFENLYDKYRSFSLPRLGHASYLTFATKVRVGN